MSLVLFTSSFPYGKTEQFLETEIEFLSKRFESITIIPISFGGVKEKRLTPNNVNIIEPVLSSKTSRIFNFKFLFMIKFYKVIIKNFFVSIKQGQLLFFISAFNIAYCTLGDARVKKIMKNSTDKDVHYYYWGHGASFILPFLEGINAKQVFRVHRGDLYEYLHNNYFPFRKEQLAGSDYVIPISLDGSEYLKEKYPEFENKIRIHRLGVNYHSYINPEHEDNCFNIVSCSALIPVKRVHLIIESLKKIKGKVHWTHFGDGNLYNHVKILAQSLPPNISYTFKGFVPNKLVLEHYSNIPVDLFINVSSSEGIPVSIMEAISYGIPVVATNAGGASEAITNDNGRLLDIEFDPSELSSIINSMIQQELVLKRIDVKASWKKLFDASKNYKQFVDFLCELI